jgi:hypothetical protein
MFVSAHRVKEIRRRGSLARGGNRAAKEKFSGADSAHRRLSVSKNSENDFPPSRPISHINSRFELSENVDMLMPGGTQKGLKFLAKKLSRRCLRPSLVVPSRLKDVDAEPPAAARIHN